MKPKLFLVTFVLLSLITLPLYAKEIQIRVSCRIPATYEINAHDAAHVVATTSEPQVYTQTGAPKAVSMRSTNTPYIQTVRQETRGNEKLIVYTVVSP